MAVATLTPVRIREDSIPVFHESRNIDAARGIIPHVKLQGLQSRNRRHYPIDVLREAAHLYNGVAVYFRPHTKNPADVNADPDPKIGWIENVTVEPTGLYGDLHLLLSHPNTARVLEAAQKNPRLYALSHDADGDLSSVGPDGYCTVRRLDAVHGLDIVDRGGSNTSLFESLQPMKMTTLKRLIEAEPKMSAEVKKRLLEAGDDALDMEFPAPDDGNQANDQPEADTSKPDAAPDAAPTEQPEDVMTKLTHVIHYLVQFLNMLKPSDVAPKAPSAPEPIAESDDSEPDADDAGGPPDGDTDDEDNMKESEQLRRDNARLTEELESIRLRDFIREEMERLKVPVDGETRAKLTDHCLRLRDKDIITEHLALFGSAVKVKTRPASYAPVQPEPAAQEAADYPNFCKRVFGREPAQG